MPRPEDTTVTHCKHSALQRAAAKGHVLVADLLIEHRANPNTRGQHGTPLQSAISSGHEEIVRSLIKAGADISSTAVLQMAAWKLHAAIFDSLSKQRCTNNSLDNSEFLANALAETDIRNSEAIIWCLVENGANLDFFLDSSNLTLQPSMNSPHLEFEDYKFVREFVSTTYLSTVGIEHHKRNPWPLWPRMWKWNYSKSRRK
jgi:ankyrin repeat protein